MGDPAQPTPAERSARRDLARRIVEAVTNDESVATVAALPVDRVGGVELTRVDATEEVLFALAQELTMLRAEIAQVDANVAAYDWAGLAEDAKGWPQWEHPLAVVARIEAARKEVRRG